MFESLTKYLILYPNCILVRGYLRSVICDLQFSVFEYIPNDLYDIIQNDLGNNIKDIYRYYGKNNHKVLDGYVNLLLKRRFAFLSDLYIQLPPLISRTDGEEKFSHAVIEVGVKTTIEDFVWYKSVLESLGIWALQIVVNNVYDLSAYMIEFEDSIIQYLEVVLDKEVFVKNKMFFYNKRIKKVIVYGCTTNDSFTSSSYEIVNRMESLLSMKDLCGDVDHDTFKINIPFYKDYLKGNTCLLGKICITESGDVKRCFFLPDIYGNLRKDKTFSFLSNPFFRQIALIKKTDIEKCKDCEHRAMCVDCRCHIKEIDNVFSAPAFCSYDPYTAKWKI